MIFKSRLTKLAPADRILLRFQVGVIFVAINEIIIHLVTKETNLLTYKTNNTIKFVYIASSCALFLKNKHVLERK